MRSVKLGHTCNTRFHKFSSVYFSLDKKVKHYYGISFEIWLLVGTAIEVGAAVVLVVKVLMAVAVLVNATMVSGSGGSGGCMYQPVHLVVCLMDLNFN